MGVCVGVGVGEGVGEGIGEGVQVAVGASASGGVGFGGAVSVAGGVALAVALAVAGDAACQSCEDSIHGASTSLRTASCSSCVAQRRAVRRGATVKMPRGAGVADADVDARSGELACRRRAAGLRPLPARARRLGGAMSK